MSNFRFIIASAALFMGIARSANAQVAQDSLVEVHGHRLHVVIGGTTKPDMPTVVFSNGLGAPIALWNDA